MFIHQLRTLLIFSLTRFTFFIIRGNVFPLDVFHVLLLLYRIQIRCCTYFELIILLSARIYIRLLEIKI